MHTGMAQPMPISTTTTRRQAGRGEYVDHGKRNHGADHHHFTVGEIDQLDDAVDHRVAQRHDGINSPKRKAVYQLLNEDVHAAPD
jgi:hypothetical protein